MPKPSGVYVWRPGSRVKADPIVAGRYIRRLCSKHNQTITREILLSEDTKNLKSPLRGEYTWDDTEAAHQYRLQQAGYLLRMISFQVERGMDRTLEVRAFPVVSDGSGNTVFRPIEIVMADPELRKAHLAGAYEEFQTFKRRWEHILELSELFQTAEKVFKKAV